MQILSLTLLFAITVAAANAAHFLSEQPSVLKPCLLTDASFKSCFAANFQTLFVEWKDGVPGLKNVGKLDPMLVKRVKIQQDDSSSFNLNAILENMTIKGASKAIIREANFNPKNLVVNVKVFAPKLRFDSDFKMKGSILALNLNGQGKSFFEAENVKLVFHINTKLRDEGGFTFSDFDTFQVKIIDIGDFHIKLENLFNGQKELEDTANELFNSNWRDLFATLRPAIEQTMELVLNDRFKKVFSFVPANFFIADIPKAADYYG